MEIKTFRAKTMPQALALVRQELGPEAMVLHTRELNASLLGRMFLGRQYEIAATPGNEAASIPPPLQGWEQPSTVASGDRAQGGSTIAQRRGGIPDVGFEPSTESSPAGEFGEYSVLRTESRGPTTSPQARPSKQVAPRPPAAAGGYDLTAVGQSAIRNPQLSASVDANLAEFSSLVEQLRARRPSPQHEMPAALFDAFTDLIEADVDEQLARELIDRLRSEPRLDPADPLAARARLAHMLEAELRGSGPIPAAPGAGRVVALVGPTGVGKTTTIAKLAANFRLREQRRVGLITVDTYRIAAVEQLRTYADIIDLPMEVVSTPREMREAVQRMRSFDLVLMDTAGRSPRDEVRIRELRSMLAEAAADEIHLVLSAASSARSLVAAAEKFAPVGVTSVLVTKLDEATGLGNLLALTRKCSLPFSYLTDGQNVPDDISVADPQRLAQLILNIHAVA